MVMRGFVILVVGFFLSSCVPSSYQRQTYGIATHKYELTVKDINGQTIEGAEIDYIIEREHQEFNKGKFITKSDSRLVLEVSKTDRLISNEVKFSTMLKYMITKEGFYIKRGTVYAVYDSDKTITATVVLLKPIDYINPSFLSSREGNSLKTNIIKFIDIIILQSLLVNAELKPRSMNLIKFKEENYLQFTFTSGTVYNSLRMNKYDVGKRLFDEVVRKVLNPLNEYISDPKTFYGYDLKVIGYTKNFADKYSEYSAGTPIEYRFMIPDGIVKKYKNKDISGQQVLDSSVILMDDERIELKLQ